MGAADGHVDLQHQGGLQRREAIVVPGHEVCVALRALVGSDGHGLLVTRGEFGFCLSLGDGGRERVQRPMLAVELDQRRVRIGKDGDDEARDHDADDRQHAPAHCRDRISPDAGLIEKYRLRIVVAAHAAQNPEMGSSWHIIDGARQNQRADVSQSLHQLPCHSKNVRIDRPGCRKLSCKKRAVSKRDQQKNFTVQLINSDWRVPK